MAFGSRFTNSGFGLTVTGLPVGTYTLTAYAHSTITGTFTQARSATVTVASMPAMSLDAPAQLGAVGSSFYAAGWAIDRTAASGTGVDAVHVWAYPNPGSGQAPVFLGAASYGGARNDVGAAFGASFTNSGFLLPIASLFPGTYRIEAFAHSTVTGSFTDVRTADVTVAGPLMALDVPSPGAIRSGPFVVAGWALDLSAASGPGVDAINIWAFPVSGGSPVFAGAGGYGVARPDLAAIFGSQFANAGYATWVALPSGTASGVYDLIVYAHSPITGTFNQWRIVRITLSP
jgi:hypothetical protein